MNGNSEFYKDILFNLYDGVYFIDQNRKITFWNKGAERITGFKSEEVVGKHCWDNILMHVDEKGRSLCSTGTCPALKTINSGKTRSKEIFLFHKDGHRVPIVTRVSPVYGDDGEVIGAVEIFSENSSIIAARERINELQVLALIDPVADIGNRVHAEISLNDSLRKMERYGWPFGVCFVDIDLFKSINDRWGHDIGDRILKMTAKTLLSGVRSSDIICRWGGEEFIAIILNVNEEQLSRIADKLRVLVENSKLILEDETITVTVSIGATLAAPGDSSEILIKRADQLMYCSKKDGRNRVTMKLDDSGSADPVRCPCPS